MPPRERLTIRLFSKAGEMNVPRQWPFWDLMDARDDIDYYVHLVGAYCHDVRELEKRQYVRRGLGLAPRRSQEVWVIRGWYHPGLLLAAFAANLRGIPIVMWAEPPGATYRATSIRQIARIRLREFMLPYLFLPFRRKTVLLGTSRYAIQRFVELTGGGRADFWPYPSQHADVLLSRPPARLPEEGEPPQLLFLGSFEHRKAVDVLAAACERLWQSGWAFRIRYVGRGPMKGLLSAHVNRSGGRAEIADFVDGEALFDEYSASHGLVLPSRWDGWGMVVHEALAAGIPAIASARCGSSTLVSSTRTGRVVPVEDVDALCDAVAWCVSLDSREREAIRARGRAAAAELTMNRLADRLIAHCWEALALSI
jgi:glycosyltransferase involved in cell wall biosynthesis